METQLIRKTSHNLPVDLLERLKVACAQKGTTQSRAVTEAIEWWIASVAGASEGAAVESVVLAGYDKPMLVSKAEARWVHSFIEILRSGVFDASEGICMAVTAFAALIRKKSPGAAPVRPGSGNSPAADSIDQN